MRHKQQYRRVDVTVRGIKYKIRYNENVIRRINDLSDKIDIRWCTSWEQDAAEALAPILELKEFDVISSKNSLESDDCGSDVWWKYVRFLNELKSGMRVVWTDDDISNEIIKRHADDNALIIRPHFNSGLRIFDLDRIEEFINKGE